MAKTVKEFLESEGLNFDTIKISRVDPLTGEEVEDIPAKKFLQKLVNHSRNRVKINKPEDSNDNFIITDERMDMPIRKSQFRIGMRHRLNFGIELSSYSDLTDIDRVMDNVDFVMLRLALIMNGSPDGIEYDKQFMKLYNIAKSKNIPVGAYLYIYSPWKFDCKKFIKNLRKKGIKLDYPLCLEYDTSIMVNDEVKAKAAEINQVLDDANILNAIDICIPSNKIDKILSKGRMTVMYPLNMIRSKTIVPEQAIRGLYDFKNGKGKNIIRAYHDDDKFIYLMCLKQKSERCNKDGDLPSVSL